MRDKTVAETDFEDRRLSKRLQTGEISQLANNRGITNYYSSTSGAVIMTHGIL